MRVSCIPYVSKVDIELKGTPYRADNAKQRKDDTDHVCSVLHLPAGPSKRLSEPLKMPLPAAGQLGFYGQVRLPELAALGRWY